MDPFTKITAITTGLCWGYFFIVRAKSIGTWLSDFETSLWDDVIVKTLPGWMLFFCAFVGTNILLVMELYNRL